MYKRILIDGIMHLGDLVVCTAIVPYLKNIYSGCQVSYLVKPGMAPLLQMVESVDSALVYEYKSKGGYVDGFRMASRIREEKIDLFISFDPRLRTSALAKIAGIPTRVGSDSVFGWNKKKYFFNRSVSLAGFDVRRHLTCETFVEVIRRFSGVEPAEEYLPRLTVIAEQDERFAEDILSSAAMAAPMFIGVSVNTVSERRNWPTKSFSQVIDFIHNNSDAQVIILGTKEDNQRAEEVLAQCQTKRAIQNLCGRTTLGQLAALLKKMSFLIHVDNGMGHMAAAVECPTITLFTNNSPLVHTPVGGKPMVVAAEALSQKEIKAGKEICHEPAEIPVEAVLEKVKAMMACVGCSART